MKTLTQSAFTLVEIMIIVAILGLLAAVAVSIPRRNGGFPARMRCIANLRQIQSAKVRWALECGKAETNTPTDADLFGAGAGLYEKPMCPKGGAYTLNAVEAKPICTIAGHAL